MNYKIQLISLIFSFFYGILFYATSYFNYKMVKNCNVVLRYLISIVYVFDISLLYILLLYKINYGVVHVYFIGVLLIGYVFGWYNLKKIRKYCQMIKGKLKK